MHPLAVPLMHSSSPLWCHQLFMSNGMACRLWNSGLTLWLISWCSTGYEIFPQSVWIFSLVLTSVIPYFSNSLWCCWYPLILWNKGSFYTVLVRHNSFQSEQTKIAESDKIANILTLGQWECMFWDSGIQMEIRLHAASISVGSGSSKQGLMSRASRTPSISYQLYWQPELEAFQISYRSNCVLASNIEVLPRKKSTLFFIFGTSHMTQFGVLVVWLLGHTARHMRVHSWMFSKHPHLQLSMLDECCAASLEAFSARGMIGCVTSL